jgi:hypothetical protein
MEIIVHFDSCHAMMLRHVRRIDAQDHQWHGGIVVDSNDGTQNDASTIVAHLSIAQHLNGPIRIRRWAQIVDTLPCSIDTDSLHQIANLDTETGRGKGIGACGMLTLTENSWRRL